MRILCQALLTAVALVTAVPGTATAHPTYHYIGGCDDTALSDGTDSSQTNWSGALEIHATATDADTGLPAIVPISVECELVINGSVPGTIMGSASGVGVASSIQQLSFNADPDDVVTWCGNVYVGPEFHRDCGGGVGFQTAALGYIDMADDGTGPTYTVSGELAGPAWDCQVSSLVPFTVTCTPTRVVSGHSWNCGVLHAAATGQSASARARSSMDCDGNGTFEAQTAIVAGMNHDSVVATSGVTVTALSCRVDGGSLLATPRWRAGCGDPGLVRLEN